MLRTTRAAAGRRRPYARLFLLLFVTHAFFYQGGGGNQNVRVLQIRALLEHHTFCIDAYRDDTVILGVRQPFSLTQDWSTSGGHYYANKTPGLTLLGVPSFALADAVLRRAGVGEERRAQWDTYFTTVCTVGLAATLLGLLMFHALRSLLGFGEAEAFWVTACFSFGTLCFSYATTFQCHLPAACCTFASLLLAVKIHHGSGRPLRFAAGAGCVGAIAVLFEPSCVIVLALVGAYLASFAEGRRSLPAFLLAAVPAGAVQLGYNWACFGAPLVSSYAVSNPLIMFADQGHLFSVPTFLRLYQVLLSPARGLFITSPVLLLALPGFRALAAGRLAREAALAALASVTLVLVVASFAGWHGGSAAGPRYLLPVLPFLFLLAAAAIGRFPWTFRVLGVAGVVANLAITAVGNELGYGAVAFPVGSSLASLAGGRVSVNPVPVPWSHWTSAFPSGDAAIDSLRTVHHAYSFNLGQIFLAPTPLSVLPLLLFWGVMGAWQMALQRETDTLAQ